METAINWALTYAALSWLSFSAWYMIRAKWWKTAFGWNTLGVSLILATIFGLLALLLAFPSFRPGLAVVALVLYVAAGVLGTHRFYLLEREQRRGSRQS